MFAYNYPHKANQIGMVSTSFVLDDASDAVEQGAFLTRAGFNAEGKPTAKVGASASTDQFLGIALNGSFSDYKVTVKEGTVTAKDGALYIDLPANFVGMESVYINGTFKTGSEYVVMNNQIKIAWTGTDAVSYKVFFKAQITATEYLARQFDTNNIGQVSAGDTLNIAQKGIFCVTNFDGCSDFSDLSKNLRVTAEGLLTTQEGTGLLDVSNHVRVLGLPAYNQEYLYIELF